MVWSCACVCVSVFGSWGPVLEGLCLFSHGSLVLVVRMCESCVCPVSVPAPHRCPLLTGIDYNCMRHDPVHSHKHIHTSKTSTSSTNPISTFFEAHAPPQDLIPHADVDSGPSIKSRFTQSPGDLGGTASPMPPHNSVPPAGAGWLVSTVHEDPSVKLTALAAWGDDVAIGTSDGMLLRLAPPAQARRQRRPR